MKKDEKSPARGTEVSLSTPVKANQQEPIGVTQALLEITRRNGGETPASFNARTSKESK